MEDKANARSYKEKVDCCTLWAAGLKKERDPSLDMAKMVDGMKISLDCLLKAEKKSHEETTKALAEAKQN